MVQRVFILGLYPLAPQSMASVFSLGDSDSQPHRHVSVLISVEDELQRRRVSDSDSRRARVVRQTGTHAVGTNDRSVCDVPGVPCNPGTQFYKRL